jgi:O-succinylbenzoate synthase
VVRVRELYADAKIRLDANGGFEIAQAIELVSELHRRGIELEYFEQPCRTIADLAELRVELHREGLSLAIAADESVRKASDPLAVAQAGAADILVLKVAPLGGVSRALSIASDAGLPIVVSSALDTSVGISAGLQLAAALPELSFDCGLATTAMLIGDVTKEPLRAENGYLDYRRVEVTPSKLDVFRAEDHRVDWWMDRLERCARL